MSVLERKLTTVRRVFHHGGTRGVLDMLKLKATSIVDRFDPRNLRNAFETWRGKEHQWIGQLVVWTGNVVRVDSCTFLVSHPAITTAAKSLFLLGGYERAERDILKAYLDRSRPVVELGGSVGVVACVTNKLLRNPLEHVVVEANPELISVLTTNRERNGCRFTVLQRALAYGEQSTIFHVHASNFLASSVQVKTGRAIQVPAVTLGGIVEEYGFATCTLVCDIEGGEVELVRHESHVLQNHVAMIIIEIHWWVGHEQAAETIRTLERIGFRCLHQKDGTYVFRNDRLHVGAHETVTH
jgi:FkbM family methyltransferase